MTAHAQAFLESQSLCDQLLARLQQAIPKLRRSSTQGSCGLYQEGRTRFAYVYHSKTKSQIEIWCRGDVEDLKRHDQELGVMPRPRQRSGWEKSFPARFRVYRADQLSAAATLLVKVSYPASTNTSRA